MDLFKRQYLLEQVNKLKNKQYEVALIAPLLMDEDLSIIEPYAQYEVLNRKYRIDLYYPQIKLAIEIYEDHHEYQIDGDKNREIAICKHLNCEFEIIKISDVDNLYSELKRIKNLILKKIKFEQSFVAWNPVSHTPQQAQKDYPNAIFYQIPKHSDYINLNPLRGPLLIAEDIRKSADLFVVYSGDTPTIISVFEVNQNSWTEYNSDKKMYYQTGNELPNHPLISSGMTQWNITTNRFYGVNLKSHK